MSIIALLASLLITTLARVRSSGRNFACKNKLKTTVFDFLQFADNLSHPNRGDSEQLGRNSFYMNDFQEREYQISEFWRLGGSDPMYRPAAQTMMCPAGAQELYRLPNLPCDGYAVTPVENVSMAINMRLYKASVILAGRPVLKNVRLSSSILGHPGVPLCFDADGGLAGRRGVLPYYSAPPAADPGLYGTGLMWFPSVRHDGQLNAGFVGGYVLSSRAPTNQPGWDWKYQPAPE